jgi:type II secretory pathway pseudopilin PulG
MQKSFTLIEALLAVTILSVAFIGVIGIFPGVIRLNSYSKDLTVASHLAESKLEEFVATGYANIPIDTNPTPVAFTDQGFEKYSWQARVTQESNELKKVEITVLWGNDNQHGTDLTTYKTQ